jgi:hypothetical protein
MEVRYFGLYFGFVAGRARSLMITVVIGFIGVAGLLVLAIFTRDLWFGIICVFILLNCGRGLLEARALTRIAKAAQACWICMSCLSPTASNGCDLAFVADV